MPSFDTWTNLEVAAAQRRRIMTLMETQAEPHPFQRMKALAAQIVATPKAEVDRREKEWRKKREKKAKATR